MSEDRVESKNSSIQRLPIEKYVRFWKDLIPGTRKGSERNAREVATLLPSNDVDCRDDCRSFPGVRFIDDSSIYLGNSQSTSTFQHESVGLICNGLASFQSRVQGCWRGWSASVPFDFFYPQFGEVHSECAFHVQSTSEASGSPPITSS